MSKQSKYSPEVRDRAVRMVFECEKDHPSQWAAIMSVAACLMNPMICSVVNRLFFMSVL